MSARRASQHGFSFIELIIVLAILSIALAMGVPQLQNSILRSRVVNGAGEFLTTLNYARNEAIDSGYDIVVCASSNQTGCSGSWGQGWIVFRDLDASNARNGSEKVIRKHNGLDNVAITPSTGASLIAFTPRGYSTATDFQFCGPGTDGTRHGRMIKVENTGRAIRSRTTGGC